MGCENCGYIAFYEVPMGLEIQDACRDPENFAHSATHKPNSDDEKLLFCQNCRTPYLVVFWSSEDTANVPQEQRK
jgi:hypothetical protein